MCAYSFEAANGPRFFTVERQDGSTSWYGDRRTNATQADGGVADGYLTGTATGQTSIVYLWAQTRFQDSTGNYIDYEYLKNPGGVDRPGEHLLVQVRYTGKLVLPGQAGSALQPYASLVFNYESTTESSSYFAGSSVWRTRRLASINSINDGVTVRHYRLSYGTSVSGSGAQTLTSVAECRDASLSVCLAPTVFSWSQARHEFATADNVSGIANGSLDKFEGLKFADVDGDGRQDLVWAKNGKSSDPCPTDGIHVSFARLDAQGRPFFANPPGAVCAPAELLGDPADSSWFLYDYDGDGRDDLFLRGPTRWVAHRSLGVNGAQGHPFDTAVDLLAGLSPSIPAGTQPNHQPQLTDLNGDGLLDVIYPSGAGFKARLMERIGGGWAWGAERVVLVDDSSVCSPLSLSSCTYANLYRLGGNVALNDFNGDGRSDPLFTVFRSTELGGCTGPAPPGDPGTESVVADSDGVVYRPMPVHGQGASLEADVDNSIGLTSGCFSNSTFTAAARVDGITAGEIRLGFYDAWEMQRDALTLISEIKFLDSNGDGLLDILFKFAASTWTLQLNTGVGFVNSQSAISISEDKHLSLIDVNGDGRTDLVFPNAARTHMVHRPGLATGGFGPEQPLLGGGAATGCTSSSCLSGRSFQFGDYDGDGGLDYLRIEWKN
ncbi:MAG: VCBS repeat-containing protein, partial [Pseudomonas sp.]|nr:VCBS repeat-containing protein [Pseudomonas sp.]